MQPNNCRTLMVQGTSSDAGKSMLVAALCRCIHNRSVAVAPFKPQNMALNSAVTNDGGEVGRAQAVQAIAARVQLSVDMNPVLLKPSSDTGAQVIIHGKAIGNMQAVGYHQYKTIAMKAVLASHKRLLQQYQYIVVEGAGSPAEINLRDRDIANMGFAQAVDCPVILIADIDRGGVFAQLVGTLELLSEPERERIVGVVINKFRGDIALLESGLEWFEQKTGKPVLGVLPYLHNLQLAAEDAIHVDQVVDTTQPSLKIAVPVFSRISNHTDFDVLRVHPQIDLVYVAPHSAIPYCDLIILPGSKNVRSDLAMLKTMGWDTDIARHLRYGGKVLGICGGYQMLGEYIHDPSGVEDASGSSKGLGYLPIQTELQPTKQLTKNRGVVRLKTGNNTENCSITGYQIHAGVSAFTQSAQHFATLDDGTLDGCISDDEHVVGTYLHGLFDDPNAFERIINWVGLNITVQIDYAQQQESEIVRLANACEKHIDWRLLAPYLQFD